MGWFDSFRHDGGNTYYDSHRIAAWTDVTQFIVIIICVVVIVAVVIVVLGTRGNERLTTFLRTAFTVHTGIVILLTFYSQQWLVTNGKTRCPYMIDHHPDIAAFVTISIGLSSVNITLKGEMNHTETWGQIQYNEKFSFAGVNQMREEVIHSKLHGLPDTIVYIGEYFSSDTGGLRWCRHLRTAGRFTTIMLWASFAMWCVYNVLLCFVVLYGAIMMAIAGLTMLCACSLYHFLQPPMPLTIPFDDTYAKFDYGWCLYVLLVSGAVTLLTGLVLILLCRTSPIGVAKVFMIDVSELEDDSEITKDSLEDNDNASRQSISSRPSQYDNKGFVEDRSRSVCTKTMHSVSQRPSICSISSNKRRHIQKCSSGVTEGDVRYSSRGRASCPVITIRTPATVEECSEPPADSQVHLTGGATQCTLAKSNSDTNLREIVIKSSSTPSHSNC